MPNKDPRYLQDVLDRARRALAAGVDHREINAAIRNRTGYAGIESLAQAVERPSEEAQALLRQGTKPEDRLTRTARAIGNALGGEEMARTAARRTGALSDFLRMAGQGLTLGFADELAGLGAAIVPGGRSGREAMEASRERVEDLRTTAPGASTLASTAGALALPVGLLSRPLRAIGSPAMRVLPRVAQGVAGGAAVGGLLGGAYGAGEAEGGIGERLSAVPPSAALGGLLGASLGLAVPAGLSLVRGARRFFTKQPGERMTGLVTRVTGIEPKVVPIQHAAREEMSRISRELYRPIQDANPLVNDPVIMGILKERRVARTVKDLFPEHNLGGPGKPADPLSFEQLQDVRNAMRDPSRSLPQSERIRYRESGEALSEAMGERIPGLREADRAFARANDIVRAVNVGNKVYSKPFEEIQDAFSSLGTEDARNAFRAAILRRLTQRGYRGRRPEEVEGMLSLIGRNDAERTALLREYRAYQYVGQLRPAAIPLTMRLLDSLFSVGGGYVGYRLARGILGF